MRRALLACALFVGVSLAGCIGGSGDGGDEERPELKSRADVSERMGGIEGLVTDAAVQPVEGGTVTILETGVSTRTASDGSYAFSNLQPNTYTLTFEAEGFVGSEEEVEVRAGQASTVDVILAHVPSIVPFSQAREFTGFVECSVRTPVVGVAVCAIPNIVFENATNDRFLFTWEVEPDPWQMVVEMQWDPNQPLGEVLALIVEPDGIPNENQTGYARVVGTSPLVANVGRAQFENVDANMTAICEGDKEPEGAIAPSDPESYCRPPLVQEGGTVWARIFVDGEPPARLGFAFQQAYHVIVTTFHHAPACAEFSVFNASECAQESTARSVNGTANGTGDGTGNSSGNGTGTARLAPVGPAAAPSGPEPRARAALDAPERHR